MAVQASHLAVAGAFPDLRHRTCGVAGDMQFGIYIDEGPPPPPPPANVLACCSPVSARKRGREQEAIPISASGIVRARMIGSMAPSTSGRPDGGVTSYLLRRQNTEIDALILLQGERIRSAVEESRRRNSRLLLAAMERRSAILLGEKEAELVAAARRNADLVEKVRLAAAEIQIWRGVAGNHEAVASVLRSALEGHGDSDDPPAAVSGDGAESSPETEVRRRRWCKGCGGGEARVALLPCRHLCLCEGCEPSIDTCPICRSVKNGILHVFRS